MNNLNIVFALFKLQRQITDFHVLIGYNGCISSRNKCNFKLGSAELFPTIKPMSSTSKTVLNSYD
jgi:hypothetical protein